MSTQSYTNKRRILAEASLVKAQYNKGVSVNNNPIYSTINCLPNFQQLTYVPACKCPFNGHGPSPKPTPTIINWIDGNNAGTGVENVSLWIDGNDAYTSTTVNWFDGGNA